MALINRLSRLFTADFHAVLDRIEEPRALLAQAIREMEEEIGNGERRLKYLRHEHDVAVAREEEAARAVAELDDKLDLCFASSEDDLARSLIRRKLERQQAAERLAVHGRGTQQAIADLAATLDENRIRLDAMQQKAAVFAEEPAGAESRAGVMESTGRQAGVTDDEIEVAFLHEKQRRASR